MKSKTIFISIFILLIIFLAYFIKFSENSINKKSNYIQSTNLSSDNKLDFKAYSTKNKEIVFSQLKGKLIIINFWATWCQPCLLEIPVLTKLQKRYPNEIAVIGINIEQKEDLPIINKFIKRLDINYPIVLFDDPLKDIFGQIYGIPSTLIFNNEQELIKKTTGFSSETTFEKLILSYL